MGARGRLEAAVDTELQQKRRRQRAGAGRRCDGPAVKALKAFVAAAQRGAAPPRTKVVPRRAPFREEVRGNLSGTVAWWDDRAANEKGTCRASFPATRWRSRGQRRARAPKRQASEQQGQRMRRPVRLWRLILITKMIMIGPASQPQNVTRFGTDPPPRTVRLTQPTHQQATTDNATRTLSGRAPAVP